MTQETKWTPGPWLDGIYHARRDGGRTLAFVTKPGRLVPVAVVDLGPDGYGREEGEANARLISVAPEMAEALTPLKALADAYFRDGRRDDVPNETAVWGFNDWTLTAGDLRRARTVLQKVGG